MSQEENENKTVTIRVPTPPRPREIYWKVKDFFVREFGWPEQMLRYPEEKLEFKLDLTQSFEENIKRLKKKYHITDEEVSRLNFSLEYTIHQLEKRGYSKELLSKIYRYVFSKEDARFFSEDAGYLTGVAENHKDNYDPDHHWEQRVLVNLLLGIAFEYACKGLLLAKDYIINEYETESQPIKSLDVKVKLNPMRTISLDVAWQFIQKENWLRFSGDEINIGNYLAYCRNMQAHTPSLMAARGSYLDESIKLIRKINREIKNVA